MPRWLLPNATIYLLAEQVANLREHWLLVCGPEKIHDLTRLRLTRQICISANPF